MITQEQEQARTAVDDRRPVTGALAAAGIAGPVIFAVVALVLGLLRPGYSFVGDPVVKLVAGPGGWVQHVSFVILGSFMKRTRSGSISACVRPGGARLAPRYSC